MAIEISKTNQKINTKDFDKEHSKIIEKSTNQNEVADKNKRKKDFSEILDKKFESSKNSKSAMENSVQMDKPLESDKAVLDETSLKNDDTLLTKLKKHIDSNQEKEAELAKYYLGESQLSQANQNYELKSVNARAILHITDLERIISTIRSQKVGDSKEVEIILKRSVFEGLNLKLSIKKDKTISLDFVTDSEKVGEIVNSQANELNELFKNRGINVRNINIINSDS